MTTAIVGILASTFLEGQSSLKNLEAWQAKYLSSEFLKICAPLGHANPTTLQIDECEKAATALLANLDTSPSSITSEQRKADRIRVEAFGYSTLGWIAIQRRKWEQAESAFERSLALDPDNAEVDYFMGTAIASEKRVDRIPAPLFYFARAAVYEGPGDLPAPARAQALTYVQRQYKNFHGNDEGLTELLALARAQRAPPADFDIQRATGDRIPTPVQDGIDPALALWKNLKRALTAPDGKDYFNASMKDAMLPTLKGKVARLEPETNPTKVVMVMEDGAPPEVTLTFYRPLEGKVDAGTELAFEGVGESFTAQPFMLIFHVEGDNLHGWAPSK